jgi:lysophospholipase L1-like esterase
MGANGGFGRLGALGGAGRPFGRLTKFATAIQGARAGTRGPAKILSLGTSIDRGQDSGASTSTLQALRSWPYVMASQFAAAGYAAAASSLVGTGGYTLSQFDSRVSAFTWSTTANYLGKNGWLATAAASLVFQDASSWDTCEVAYIQAANTSSFTITCGADAPVTVNTTNASTVARRVITRGASTDAVTLAWASGTIIALSVYLYKSTDLISVVNAAGGGESSVNFVGGSSPFNHLSQFDAWQPDLTIGYPPVNDERTSIAEATYLANLDTIATHAKVTGDIVFMGATPIADSFAPAYSVQSTWNDDIAAKAATYNAPFIDLFNRYGGTVAGIPGGAPSDNLHPTFVCYADIAAFTAQKIIRG